MKIFFHSDDYGINAAQADVILDCAQTGCLNSLSVMPNSACLPEAMERLSLLEKRPHIAVHLNYVEGPCCAGRAAVPLLTDERGCFSLSFAQLLLKSLLPGRKALYVQLKAETRAQLKRVASLYPAGAPLRIDSHQHFHAIPLLYGAILETLSEEGLRPAYIRMPDEPVWPYLKRPRLFLSVPPVNWVKQALLRFLLLFDEGKRKKAGIPTALFCGVVLTGRMDAARVLAVLPDFLARAARKGADVECLFHPGRLAGADCCLDPRKTDFVRFNLSPNRDIEREALHAPRMRSMADIAEGTK